jgi:outer membrane protein assembly factor BamA
MTSEARTVLCARRLSTLSVVLACAAWACAVAADSAPAAAGPRAPAEAGPSSAATSVTLATPHRAAELVLTLSLELSTEQGNALTGVARAIRTELFTPGDQLDIQQRVSKLRKELNVNYVAPTNGAPFQLVSHEVSISETGRRISESKNQLTSQASYRQLWTHLAPSGVWAVGFGAEALRLDSTADTAPYLQEFVARQGRTSSNLPLIGLWSYDRRPGNRILPVGHLDRVTLEWGTPLASTHYAKVEYRHESYFAVSPRLAAGFNATVGALRGLRGDLTPLTKRYFGGGVGTVRGYEAGALSPLDTSKSGMGANRQTMLSLEALWHAFSLGETPVILSAFYDYGRFRDTGSAQTTEEEDVAASSYGVGVSLPVRIGLVRFSFAKPRTDNQRTQHFQFDARANWR